MKPLATSSVMGCCALAGLLFSMPAAAQGLQEKLAGTWIVESVVNEQDGKRIEPFGPNPKGYFIFTRDGHYSFQIVRPDRIKFAANNKNRGTAEENRQAMEGTVTVFGTYKVANEQDGTIHLHVVGSNYPNWDGTDQVRKASVNGDEMLYTNPAGAIGGNVVQKLRRAK